jgi:Fe2+ or Zn2+ uptake regulation protein
MTQQEYAELLRSNNLKATPRRMYLLSLLEKAKIPLSAHELKAMWKQGETNVVTLYRALEALAVSGIVRRVDVQHGHTDYELVVSGEHHHHLVCTGCGTIEDVEGCPAKSIEKRALKDSSKFSSLQEHSLEFFGTCNKCAA